jgi:hypothetical protein
MASIMTITHHPDGLGKGSSVTWAKKGVSPLAPAGFPAAEFEDQFGFSADLLPRKSAADLREFAAKELGINVPKSAKKAALLAAVMDAAAGLLAGAVEGIDDFEDAG